MCGSMTWPYSSIQRSHTSCGVTECSTGYSVASLWCLRMTSVADGFEVALDFGAVAHAAHGRNRRRVTLSPLRVTLVALE
jgi:hypothetical protein